MGGRKDVVREALFSNKRHSFILDPEGQVELFNQGGG
jgi:hypothetical protein